MSLDAGRLGPERLMELSVATAALQSIIAELALPEPPDPAMAQQARDHLRLRRLRDRAFPEAVFGEPSWEILLDLYVALQTGRRLSVSALCIIPGVPPTTALRHLGELVRRELVVREPCPNDGRRVYVSLATETVRRLGAVFGAL